MPLIMVFGYLEEVRSVVYTWDTSWKCLMVIYLMHLPYTEVSYFLQNDDIYNRKDIGYQTKTALPLISSSLCTHST